MRKVLYLSLKEFRSAQKRQLEDGPPTSNGKPACVAFICVCSACVRALAQEALLSFGVFRRPGSRSRLSPSSENQVRSWKEEEERSPSSRELHTCFRSCSRLT